MKFAPSFSSRQRVRATTLAVTALGVIAAAGPAYAKRGGVDSQNCSGCHSGTPSSPMTASLSQPAIPQGGMVTLTIKIPSTAVGGFFLFSDPPGQFIARSGEGTHNVGTGIAHSAPKTAVGGTVTFVVDYKAAAGTPGVLFQLAAVAGNGDNNRRGDSSGQVFTSIAVGCSTGTAFNRDFDGDGFGRQGIENQMMACSKPKGFSENDTDCDDNDSDSYPGKPEICNERDDNCDGKVDEDLAIEMLFEDEDGDGYGRPGSQMKLSCGPLPGWGVGGTDCDDKNKEVHPNAMEMCNRIDDDCDQRVDEGAKEICGEGWCRRAAPGCYTDACVPGKPREEQCNLLDDDCDGEVDEGDLCPVGETCYMAECVPSDTVPEMPIEDTMSGSGGASGGEPSDGSPRNQPDDRGEAGGCNASGRTPQGPWAAIMLAFLMLAFRRRQLVGARRRVDRG